MNGNYHIAQANIARMRASQDDPLMTGFVERIEPLNALADSAPGFVWRFKEEDGDVTAAEVFGDDRILFNLSVWKSIEALEAYVYQSGHVSAVQKRARWFERWSKPPLVLWWIDSGHIPNVMEARQRFERLWRDGPSRQAFTFRTRFQRMD